MRFALLLLLPIIALAKDDDNWIVRDFHRHIVYPLKDAMDNFIYVTFSLDNEQAIQLDFHDGRESCVIPHDLTYNSRSRYKVAVLGNGKVVTTMMNNQEKGHNIRLATQNLEWKLSIVDPENCTYQHKVIGHYKNSFTDILPYMNTFDLDGNDDKVNRVVRFKDDGELEGLSAKIPDERYLGIRIAKEFDSNEGYYYVVPNIQEDLSVIKKLDSKFEVTKTYKIKGEGLSYDTQSYSVTFGRITFCYFNDGRTNLECIGINGELNRELFKAQLTYKHELSETTVVNFEEGGFAVVYVHITGNEKKIFTIYAQRVSEKGKVFPIVKIGKVKDEMYNIYAFVMKDGQLCVVATSRDLSYQRCTNL